MRFLTQNGLEVPAVTADQMREIDRIAMDDTGPNLFQMMENAGRSLASLALELLGVDWQRAGIAVLAGSGGNGGGGICAARHLANRGARILLCLSNPQRLSGVTDFQRKIFQHTAGREISPNELMREKPDLIIDAMVGYSLKGPLSGTVLDLVHWANRASAPVLSLDVPTGIDATNGRAQGEFVRARWTLTLALPKTGLAAVKQDALYLADLGIPAKTFERLGLHYASPFGRSFYIPLKIED